MDNYEATLLEQIKILDHESNVSNSPSAAEAIAGVSRRLQQLSTRLTTERGCLTKALRKFVDHYPHGINPFLDEAAAMGRAALASLAPAAEKRAPVQGYVQGIPWEMHLRAYNVYAKKWRPQPALIEGGCRGGFSVGELDEFIPGWRDELEELPRLRAQVAALTAQCEVAEESLSIMHAQHKEESARIDELTAQCEGLRKDAERWQFFRKVTASQDEAAQGFMLERVQENATEADLDAAVDFAHAAGNGEGV